MLKLFFAFLTFEINKITNVVTCIGVQRRSLHNSFLGIHLFKTRFFNLSTNCFRFCSTEVENVIEVFIYFVAFTVNRMNCLWSENQESLLSESNGTITDSRNLHVDQQEGG